MEPSTFWSVGDYGIVVDLPLASASADLVTSTFGIVFAADPAAAIGEARRLLRPGGRLLFTSWSPNGLFGAIRVAMADYFPDAPTPWHESESGIRGTAGADATVAERTFELTVPSPERFVEQMERWSSPIVLAAESLGDRWPEARSRLQDVVNRAGSYERGAFRVEVPYLVTTILT